MPVQFDQAPQVGNVGGIFDALKLNGLGIAPGIEAALRIPDIGDPPGHAGGEIPPGRTQNHRAPAGHVLAAMIAHAFDDRLGAAVANAETLGRTSPEEGPSAGGAIEGDVADDDVLLGYEGALPGWVDDQPATGQPLADVIVAVAFEFERDSLRQKRSETLSGRAVQLDVDGVVGERGFAPGLDHLVAENRSHRAVGIDDGQIQAHAPAVANRVLGQFHQPLVQCPFKAVILGNGAPDLDILVGLDRRRQYGRQVQSVSLPVVDRVADLERIDATDHVVHAAEAQLRHQFPGLLGHQEQVVDDVLGRTGELLAQHRVLGRDPHRTGVEMTLAHHDAAQGDQRTRGEAHLLGTEQSGDHHIPPGLQSSVGLQDHAAAQVVHHQGLVSFRDAQFPRQAGMLDAGERRGPGAAGIA